MVLTQLSHGLPTLVFLLVGYPTDRRLKSVLRKQIKNGAEKARCEGETASGWKSGENFETIAADCRVEGGSKQVHAKAKSEPSPQCCRHGALVRLVRQSDVLLRCGLLWRSRPDLHFCR